MQPEGIPNNTTSEESQEKIPVSLERDEFFCDFWKAVKEDASENEHAKAFIQRVTALTETTKRFHTEIKEGDDESLKKELRKISKIISDLSEEICSYVDSELFTGRTREFHFREGSEVTSIPQNDYAIKILCLPQAFQKVIDALELRKRYKEELSIVAPMVGDRFDMDYMLSLSDNHRVTVSKLIKWGVRSGKKVYAHAVVETTS